MSSLCILFAYWKIKSGCLLPRHGGKLHYRGSECIEATSFQGMRTTGKWKKPEHALPERHTSY